MNKKKILKKSLKTFFITLLVVVGLFSTWYFWPVKEIINPIESKVPNYNPKSFWAPWGDHMHAGIDIFADEGTPIRAAAGGFVSHVITVEDKPDYIGGNTVRIIGMGGLRYHYAHMSKIIAKKYTFVKQGEIIGLVGRTGNASRPGCPPHCHFAIRKLFFPIPGEKEHPHLIDPATLIKQ